MQDSYACDQELTNHIDTPAECKRELDELLAAMPVEDREIRALRFVAGLSLQEIADITR